MVDQAARSRDQDIDAPVDQHVLFLERDATDQKGLLESRSLGIGIEVLGHLRGQFPRRRQYKRPGHPGAGTTLAQQRDHRKGETGGLAGAGLGNAQYIAPFQCWRDRSGLNRGGSCIAGGLDGLENLRIEVQVGKACHVRPGWSRGPYCPNSGVAGRPSLMRPSVLHLPDNPYPCVAALTKRVRAVNARGILRNAAGVRRVPLD